MRMLALLSLPFVLGAAQSAYPTALELIIEQQRSARGVIHVCLTRDRRHFPDCSADPLAVKRSVPAGTDRLRLVGYPPGRYALTLFHDENSNQKLDMILGVPKEGFGFSRNPRIRFGAPKFEKVDIHLESGVTRTTVRMQYIL